ncbi:hypothetical protein KY317_01670, partial [Candidatus Woesearchaeota archaeon]|nr:hypothetical protein [Candidatus Woesearchaeota archaeon]
ESSSVGSNSPFVPVSITISPKFIFFTSTILEIACEYKKFTGQTNSYILKNWGYIKGFLLK